MTETARLEPTPGLVLVDKPPGWTSHDVVGRMRRLAATSKVGHAGTLDPMATGVLVVGIGKATKLLTYIVGTDKTYEATIRLGQSTLTDDAEGEVTATADASGISESAILEAIAALTGPIQQVPSAVSAIKIDGQRAYKRVRDGEDVQLPPRPVTVHRFEVRDIRRDGTVVDCDVVVDVSSGTYVRALARDLGASLSVGGHLTALRRTAVGAWGIEQARPLEDLAAALDAGQPLPLIPLAAAAAAVLPSLTVTPDQVTALGFGKRIVIPGAPADGPVALITDADALVAIASLRGDALQPDIVFAPAGAQ